MRDFKFFKGFYDGDLTFYTNGGVERMRITSNGFVGIGNINASFTPENVEFCFQFGNEEPIVFATGPNECSIRLSPTSDANITFNDNDRKFKLFAREIQS